MWDSIQLPKIKNLNWFTGNKNKGNANRINFDQNNMNRWDIMVVKKKC